MFTKKYWTEGVGSYAVAILIALTIRWAFMEAYVIPSGSMLPTLLVHDHIFVNKMVYGVRVPFTEKWLYKAGDPERGEVIVFKYPENEKIFYIKRVVGVPGDRIFYENGKLYINDKLVEKKEPNELKGEFNWLRDKDLQFLTTNDVVHWEEQIGEQKFSTLLVKDSPSRTFGPYQVPQDSYFVMGDNRDNSKDSRLWSPDKTFVPRDNLIGRAMFVWLSCDETIPGISFLCNPLTIRGKRFFHNVH